MNEYTAQDIQLAHEAARIKRRAIADSCSLKDAATREIVCYDQDNGILLEETAKERLTALDHLARGLKILSRARLIYGPLQTTTAYFPNMSDESPTILVDAGFIARSQAWRAAALRAR